VDLNVILGIAVASVVVIYLLRSIAKYLASLGVIFLRSVVAFFFIWAVNIVGGFFGFHIGLNVASALAVGALGIPGVGLILAIKYLL